MRFFVTILVLVLMLSACATPRTMTRDEWLAVSQRTYTDVTKEELIRNAQKVLFMVDGDDFSFSHHQDGFMASRQWFIYVVLAAAAGTDTWTFKVEEKDGKILASIQAYRNAGNMTGYAAGNQAGVVTSPTMGSPVQGPVAYNMFWGRLDYLLGLGSQWPDCRIERKRVRKKETWGDLSGLCESVTVNDELPNNLSDSEVERIFHDRPIAKKEYLKTRVPSKN